MCQFNSLLGLGGWWVDGYGMVGKLTVFSALGSMSFSGFNCACWLQGGLLELE